MSEQKKGLSPLAWVGIGCVGLVVLIGIGLMAAGWFVSKKVKEFAENPVEATARTIALASPEIEFVSSDEETRTVVFRNEKTGEEITLNFEDIENGNFSFENADGQQSLSINADGAASGGGLTITTDEGTATIGSGGGRERIPAWVPIYPGAGVNVGFTSSSDEGSMGMIELTDWASGEEVIEFYATKLEEEGYEVTRNTLSFGDNEQVMLSGTHEGEKRTVSAQWVNAEGESKVLLQYNQR